jgi:hypothetical protein
VGNAYASTQSNLLRDRCISVAHLGYSKQPVEIE